MGCDIHMYVEYKRKDSDYFSDFGGRINPGRNYWMFGILAGVRSDANNLFPPKGIPDDLAYASRNDYLEYISENANDDNDFVTLETAQKYETYGKKIINNREGKPTWVEHPDWHTPTWLTVDEYEKCMEEYNANDTAIKYREPEYEAVLAAMKKLSEFGGEVRIVFWFDN